VTRPRLATGARLRYDEVREEHLLLVPEGAVRLNPTAAEVLELCDGERSLEDIVGVLSARYNNADLTEDVRELVDGMAARGLLVDAAPFVKRAAWACSSSR
jgi:pyrroloquinoline quinone biosynthesis protein D